MDTCRGAGCLDRDAAGGDLLALSPLAAGVGAAGTDRRTSASSGDALVHQRPGTGRGSGAGTAVGLDRRDGTGGGGNGARLARRPVAAAPRVAGRGADVRAVGSSHPPQLDWLPSHRPFILGPRDREAAST